MLVLGVRNRHGCPMTTSSAPLDVSEAAIAEAAQRLIDAFEANVGGPFLRDLIGERNLPAAYAVQEKFNATRLARGAKVVGRKIGATSLAVQNQLGGDQPDLGVLFEDMDFTGRDVPMSRLIAPKVEGEVGFVLKADLVDGDLDADQVRAAIDYAVVALEICDSRIAGWDIAFADTVADNASAGVYVLGSEHKTLDEVTPVDVEMTMSINGEVVSTGNGAACLGDPINAVVWLARMARDLGEPLRAGQVILSGALGPMAPVNAGDTVTVTVTGLGTITTTFVPSEEA